MKRFFGALLAVAILFSNPSYSAIRGFAHLDSATGQLLLTELPAAGSVVNRTLTVNYTDFSTAGLTRTVDILNPGEVNYKVLASSVVVITPFAGTGVTNLNMELGFHVSGGGAEGALVASYDILPYAFAQSRDQNNFTNIVPTGLVTGVSIPVAVTATAVGANLDQLTAGQLQVMITYVVYP